MNISRSLPILVAAAALATALPAQIQAFGGPSQRACSTIVLFDQGAESAAGLSIQYGQPQWMPEYDNMADKAKDARFRFGKDWWTTFDCSTGIELGGAKVPAGSYFLGLEADKEGKFSLCFIDSKHAMTKGQMPWDGPKWTIAHSVPLKFEKGALDASVEKLNVDLKKGDDDPTKLAIEITWGTHRLSAKGKIMFGGAAEAGHDKGKDGDKGGDLKGDKKGKEHGK